MASMLLPKNKEAEPRRKERYENPPPATPAHPHTLHALSIGKIRKVRQRGMLSKTLRKKKRDTRHNTQRD